MHATLTKPQDTQTSCPAVQTKPENTQGRHPAIVRYRLFSKSRLDTKTFGPTQEGRQAMADFLRDMGAKAELINNQWVLTDKGQVDYMTVGFVDSELLAQQEAKRVIAKHMIANWKAMKAAGTA
jgi:hypothetical protein